MSLPEGISLEQRGAWAVLDIKAESVSKYQSPEYMEDLRLKLGEQRFRREILGDWTVAAGEPYFPECGEDPEGFTFDLPYLLDSPMHVGLDFGQKFPAAVWVQYDEEQDRIFAIREWMPPILTAAHTFRDVTLWLAGQKTLDRLIEPAQHWANRLSEDPYIPRAPWFGPAPQLEFAWWTGHEASISRAEVAADSEERSTADIWQEDGIYLSPHIVPVDARILTLRKLLIKRPDGWPGIVFSERGCPILLEGMRGGITFATATKNNPMPDRPKKDGWYEHLLDALGYAVVNVAGYRRIGKIKPVSKVPAPMLRRGNFERYEQPQPKTAGFTFSTPWSRFGDRYR